MTGQPLWHKAEKPRTTRGLERLIFFTDAVVAIAITLIALPLVDSAREVTTSTASKFLSENTFAIIAAGVSFVVISAFWREHHTTFERATGYTPLLIRVNMLWLVGIVTIPVATVLIVYTHRDDRVAIGLYIGLLVYTLVITRLIELLLYRADLLSDHPTGTDIALRWLYVGVAVVAMLLGIFFPHVGMWWLLLLLLNAPIQTAIRRGLSPGEPDPAAPAE
ncbi:TMEM175 family protein [Nocardia sp. alder85J]|uniref:TMEM175 family protein n=1 Tax=Nocardia sp. alder85J TaxID=2862949 RepID=UPI001CD576EE|nr:TMEM175 family protein [Nocardia sp. alder85J]MCX4097531.1 TMEM175 family protein [Nocardia sp. alder85J]